MNLYNLKLILVGILCILSFDAIASLLTRNNKITYVPLSIFSLLLYIAFGYYFAKDNTYLSVVTLTALIGLVDATLGLKLSLTLNPEYTNIVDEEIDLESPGMVIFMVIIAGILGFIGSLLHRYIEF